MLGRHLWMLKNVKLKNIYTFILNINHFYKLYYFNNNHGKSMTLKSLLFGLGKVYSFKIHAG